MSTHGDMSTQRDCVQALLLEIADVMGERHTALTNQVFDEFVRRIPELDGDTGILELLRGSTSSNLENFVHLLRGHVPIDDVQVPPAAAEYARRLAQRGASPSALLRAYRLGQQLTLSWLHDRIAERKPAPDIAFLASRLLTDTSFAYIDAVSEGVVNAYQAERDQWLANRSTVQRETAEAVIRGAEVDAPAVEAALAYRVRQHHLGVLLWHVDAGAGGADLGALEDGLRQVAQRVGVTAPPLFVPRDRATGWGWVPLGRSGALPGEDLADVAGADLRVAIGRPGAGLEGFRRTHLEAVRAHQVAAIGGGAVGGVTSYGDPGVRAAGLMVTDLEGTRLLVGDSLGDLAVDTAAAGRLRETLRAFLERHGSYVATAEQMHLHKNTVKYRVDRALAARGKPLEEDRLELELALVACSWLGSAVLPSVAATAGTSRTAAATSVALTVPRRASAGRRSSRRTTGARRPAAP